MTRRLVSGMLAVACCVLCVVSLLVAPPEASAPPTKEAFGLSRVWHRHLDVSAKEFEAMQPVGGFFMPGGKQPPKKAKDKRDRDRNLWGMEFPWAQGTLTASGKTYKIGLRYDG